MPPAGSSQDLHPRVSSSIPIAQDAAVIAITVPWRRAQHELYRTVIAKMSCDLVDRDFARPLAEQAAPRGEVLFGEGPLCSVKQPSELAVFKQRADITLWGTAYAPASRANSCRVRFAFRSATGGSFDRSAQVFGYREWGGEPYDVNRPGPLSSQQLCWEHAFGGAEHALNIVGSGMTGTRLPSIEDPRDLLRRRRQRPEPMGFAPIPHSWPHRARQAGRFDDEWAASLFACVPRERDPQWYQSAPLEQQLGPLRGDEHYILEGMHPDHKVLQGQLPGIRLRAFAEHRGDRGFREVKLALDGVHFDVEENRLQLVWRGHFAVGYEDARDIVGVYLAAEGSREPPMTMGQAEQAWRGARQPLFLLGEQTNEEVPNDNARRAPNSQPIQTHSARIQDWLRGAPAAPSSTAAPVSTAAPPIAAPSIAADPAARQRLARLLAAGKPLDGIDFQHADLTGADFRGRSLIGINLRGARLAGCCFAGADLAGAQLSNAYLVDAVFDGARLDLCDFSGAQLDGASLVECSLVRASFEGATGRGARFHHVRGESARFYGGVWTYVEFAGADLAAADFGACELDHANFREATLTDIRLLAAKGSRCVFNDADMRGARAEDACLTECSFSGANLNDGVFDGAKLDRSTFRGSDLSASGMRAVSAVGADFSAAKLTDARCARALLSKARLVGANLAHAELEDCDLRGADLTAANLHCAETWKANFEGAMTNGTVFSGTKRATS